jgi:glycosyltransferase involved in cell wall biosynthesis
MTVAHRTRDVVAGVQWRPAWARAEENPADPDPVTAPLFAIMSTFNESDVVEAAVHNAYTQGAERVYLLDNASTDDTVARAVGAGAILAESYTTECFEESLRIVLMNAAVWRISSAEAADHIWWLWMDADEFSHGPGDQRISAYLATLDRRFRVVGADFFQHFPVAKPEYVRGFHPLEFQPMCEPFSQPPIPQCRAGHFKHPLQRFDRTGPFVSSLRGFHMCQSNDRSQLVEPTPGIVTHHFQYRDEDLTRRRLAEVYGPGASRGAQLRRLGASGGDGRLRSVDAVYAHRWAEVDNQRHIRGDVGVQPRPWSDFSGWTQPRRWYDADELDHALGRRTASSGPPPNGVFRASAGPD